MNARKSFGVEIKPVYAWCGFERYVGAYVVEYYGGRSERFPRRGMAESWIKAEFRNGREEV